MMNSKKARESQCSSTQDVGTNQKRRRLDPANSSSPQSSAHDSGCHNKMWQELSDRVLEHQAAADTNLRSILLGAKDPIRKLNDEKADMSNEITKLTIRVRELLNENTHLVRRADDDKSKLNAAEKKIIDLQEKLKDTELQRMAIGEEKATLIEFISQGQCLVEKMQTSFSKAARINKLGGSVRGTASRSEIATAQAQGCQTVASLKQQLASLQGQCDELTLKVQGYESNKRGVTPSALKDEYHHLIQENERKEAELEALKREMQELQKSDLTSEYESLSSDGSREDGASHRADADSEVERNVISEPGKPNLRISSGGYSMLVSDARYFEIDWKRQYTHVGARCYSCHKCSKELKNQNDVKDHIWVQHYKGKFKCVYCDKSTYSWRNCLVHYMRVLHPNISTWQ